MEALDLRALVALVAGLAFVSSLTLAQSPKPQVIIIRSAASPVGTIVVPAASPMHLVSPVSRNGDVTATFRGRFTLAGIYKIEGSRNDTALSFWPDRKSSESLPHWKDRDVPDEIFISNEEEFTRAVVPRDKLAKLKKGAIHSVRGRVTIIADDYETSIDCDVVSASARFVSLVRNVQVAANPQEEETC